MTNFYFPIGFSVDQMKVHTNKKNLQYFKFLCGDTTLFKISTLKK